MTNTIQKLREKEGCNEKEEMDNLEVKIDGTDEDGYSTA